MRRLQPLYPLVLALLVGGNVLYTFLATPVIFARFERDLAGRVVAAMMPWYFGYGAALFLAANALFWLSAEGRGGKAFTRSASLLGVGLVAALAVAFWLYPAMVEVRSQVASFAADAPMTGPRLAFRRLHGLSSALNLLLLGVGTALLLLAPRTAHPPGPPAPPPDPGSL
jgi:hypothetical protein